MSKLTDILNEVLAEMASPIVYHMTRLDAVYDMLKNDRIRMTTVIGTKSDMDMNKGNFYYFSTARSRDSSYFRTNDYTVILTLDGIRLGSNLKASAVDYWKRDFAGGNKAGGTSDEHEDRFFSNKQYQNGARKFIKKIEILLPSQWENKITSFDRILKYKDLSDKEVDALRGKKYIDTKQLENDKQYVERIRQIWIEAKKYNIPILFYTDEVSFRYGKSQNAINVDVSLLKGRKKEKWDDPDYYSYSYQRGYKDKLVVQLYYDAATEDNVEKMSYNDRDAIRRLVWGGQHAEEFIRGLKNDIHNKKSTGSKWINRLIMIMKQEGYKSVDELVDYIIDKWKPAIEAYYGN